LIKGTATSLDPLNPENITLVNQYGINSAPPVGTNCIMFAPFGYAENIFAISLNAAAPKIQPGETIVYDNFGNKIYLKSNGDIDIIAAKNVNITAATTSASGDINTQGVYKVDGVQVVTTQQPAIIAPTGGSTVDAQARTAINSLITTLQTHGLIV
jgi:phage gp45-like